jgi:hypothetical protein
VVAQVVAAAIDEETLVADARPQVKVVFRLERDENGYPPFDQESVWAYDLGNGEYEIGNIPFYAQLLSCGHVVSARLYNGELWAESLVRASGNSTARVFVKARNDVPPLRQRLRELGCSSELDNTGRLVAINVPPQVAFAIVQAVLREGEAQGRWGYEESAISLQHQREIGDVES